ncbi:MAG: helix-turn-helix transcriptional regulator [Leucobacter sp.]|jgi:AcrR family transcriptional regulator|nr:helix-turn-helix transcriptional regulator [Leucobacter sp.]
MRADAAQRQRRILTEARHLFAERGHDISLDAIAEASEVGIATLYRNFASRADLIVAVTLDVIADIEAALAQAQAAITASPQRAWEQLVRELVGLNLGAMTDAVGDASGWNAPPEVTVAQDATLKRFDDTLRTLAHHDAVRSDLRAIETIVAIGILTRPQPEAIQRITPHLVDHLVDAFLAWSRRA